MPVVHKDGSRSKSRRVVNNRGHEGRASFNKNVREIRVFAEASDPYFFPRITVSEALVARFYYGFSRLAFVKLL